MMQIDEWENRAKDPMLSLANFNLPNESHPPRGGKNLHSKGKLLLPHLPLTSGGWFVFDPPFFANQFNGNMVQLPASIPAQKAALQRSTCLEKHLTAEAKLL